MSAIRYARGLVLVLGLSGGLAWAQAGEEAAAQQQAGAKAAHGPVDVTAAEAEARARRYFTDLEVIDQYGESRRFYTDVLKGQVVLINFIFTNCQEACPLQTQMLTRVMDSLGPRMGEDVRFVSISIDPERDTPEAMREFAEKQNADHAGWLFITGDPANMKHITQKLGQYTDDPEVHSTLMIAGNVRTQHWLKIPPQTPPRGIVERLIDLTEEG